MPGPQNVWPVYSHAAQRPDLSVIDVQHAGFSSTRIDRWVQDGRLHPVYPGVYAWGRRELSEAGRHAAALLFSGQGSGLTGLTALWWQGLLGTEPTLIHVDTTGRSRSRADLVIRHPRTIRMGCW